MNWTRRSILLGLLGAICASIALAQTPGSRPGGGGPPPGRRGADGPGRGAARDIAGLPIRPSPSDFGPLRPGEREELQQFARQRFPDLARAMSGARGRDPQRFASRFDGEIAPRLRLLRRVFDEDPELGRELIRYAGGRARIRAAAERARFAAQDGKPPAPAAATRLRQLVEENVRSEATILRARGKMLARLRDQELDQVLGRLADRGVTIAALPPHVRPLAEQLRNADEARAGEVRAAVRDKLGDMVDREVAHLEREASRILGGVDREVDQRVRELLRAPRAELGDAPRSQPSQEP